MKKIISLILTIAMLISAVAMLSSCGDDSGTNDADNKETEKQTLKVYTHAGFPPFEYLDDKGNVVGVDIDVVNYIGEQLGYNIEINDIEFNQIFAEIENDKLAVGAAGISKKPERDAIALSTEVYATSIQYVIAPKGTFEGEIVPIADVVAYALEQSNKAIGVQKGTTGADMVAGAVEGTDAGLFEYSNAIVASQDIGSTVSAVVIDKMPAESICKDNADLECWCLDGDMESYVMYFNLEATELVAQVNEVLEKMIADGTIDQFIVNHS